MKAKIEIIMEDNGQMVVNGPITNLALCYGMLEVAKDVVREHCAKTSKSPIIPASAIPRLVE